LSSEQGIIIKKQILKTCKDLKKYSVPLVDTFMPSEELMDSFIAPNDGDLYGSIIGKIMISPKSV